MRPLLVLMMLLLILGPALLALWQPSKPLAVRIAWAVAILAVPLVLLGIIHGIPQLDGRALHNANAWTTLRLVLTGLVLLLPSCLCLIARR
ncbi:MAG: hypothetical protein ACRDBH_07260 [Bosea sp. (in: a-proteobacteria)]